MHDLTDTAFLQAFESGGLQEFHHRDHVRLALLYVERFGPLEAEQRMCDAIRVFANRAGKPEKFHLTMTVGYVRLAAHLLDKTAMSRYYSASLLNSEAARSQLVEPDLNPLP